MPKKANGMRVKIPSDSKRIEGKKIRTGTPSVDEEIELQCLHKAVWFFRYTNWRAMWEEWYYGVDAKNNWVYKTIRQFAVHNSKSKTQFRFLVWYLGPDLGEGTPEEYDFIKTGPVDWLDKRNNGGWFTKDNLKQVRHEITKRSSAIDRLAEVGNLTSLTHVLRAEELAVSIDNYFRGAMCIPGLTMKEQVERMNTYLEFQERLLNYAEKAQNVYAKSQGIDMNNLDGVMQIILAPVLQQAAQQTNLVGGDIGGRDSRVISKLVDMVVSKADRYNLKLPKPFEDKIIEVVAEEEAPTKRKKAVQ